MHCPVNTNCRRKIEEQKIIVTVCTQWIAIGKETCYLLKYQNMLQGKVVYNDHLCSKIFD